MLLDFKPEESINKSSLVRVLIVDDFKPWLKRVTDMLGSDPILQIVGTALDGPEAIAQALFLKPDLVLMDIGLPSMSGIEAARQIISLIPDIKIIFVSVNMAPEIAHAAFAVGGRAYVIKPNAYRELSFAIKAVLGGMRYVGRGLPDFDVPGTLDTQPAWGNC